jgi:phenylacetate-CoA ligase
MRRTALRRAWACGSTPCLLVISRDGHLDQLEVAAELRQLIKTHVGVSTQVRLLPCNGIERSLTGKARRVIDRRPRH